jgi:agmatine deiminase
MPAAGHVRGPDYAEIRSEASGFLGSYAHYHLCNGAVVTAEFGDRRADASARRRSAWLFPGHRVVHLRVDDLASGGGGIDCMTQRQPR